MMASKHIALALACATATCAPLRPAAAQAACAPYPQIAEILRRDYGETLRLRARDGRGAVLEFFAHDGKSWTLVVRRGERACAIAAGLRWREHPQPGIDF
jgi:hypothetical protein